MIRLHNVTQHYGVRPILRNINLTIPAGKLTSIIGPNGMGKSTLIKVIAGLLSPQYGSVEIDGKIRRSSVRDELAIRKQVAYCPDKGWLPKSLSGREFVNQVAALYEIDDLRRMQHADSLFRVFELEDQADQSISNYSNGQKQKISICAALITDAPILLMDEPFSNGLDPAGMLALKEILRHLVDKKDRTVLIATPIPELVEEISDLVAIVKEGELFAYGAIRDLQQQFGCDGTLSSILQTAIHPQSSQNIDEYVKTI